MALDDPMELDDRRGQEVAAAVVERTNIQEVDHVDVSLSMPHNVISIEEVDALGLVNADFNSESSPVREENFLCEGNCWLR
jgi:hypothetical protein